MPPNWANRSIWTLIINLHFQDSNILRRMKKIWITWRPWKLGNCSSTIHFLFKPYHMVLIGRQSLLGYHGRVDIELSIILNILQKISQLPFPGVYNPISQPSWWHDGRDLNMATESFRLQQSRLLLLLMKTMRCDWKFQKNLGSKIR